MFSNVQFAAGDKLRISQSPARAERVQSLFGPSAATDCNLSRWLTTIQKERSPQRKWPSIWQQHQRCPFQRLSHFLWSFSPRITGADKGGRDCNPCRLEPSVNTTAVVDSDGKSPGNDYITPPLPAEPIPPEKSLSEVRAVMKITTFSHSE